MCETYPPERCFVVCVIIRGGVPPFSVREESLLNSKHISPERYFVSVFTFVHIGVPPFSVREDSLLNLKHISPECNIAIVRTNTSYPFFI